MKCVVVDDEINAANHLASIIKTEGYSVLETCTDSSKVLDILKQNSCDILFLDINMPFLNGIQLAEIVHIVYPSIKICFVTSYHEYAIKAFEVNAIDYILKPFSNDRVLKLIKKISTQQLALSSLENINDTIEYKMNKIPVFDSEEIIILGYGEIFYFEALSKKIYVHTKDKIYLGKKTLTFYEKKLESYSFFKTHKSYLVNLNKVKKVVPKISYNYDVFFNNIENTIPISRSRFKFFKLCLDI